MNTSAYRLVAAISIAMILVLNSTSSFAGNYTWTGNSSSAWSVSSNWSPSGVPTTNDTVTIGSGSDTIQMGANTTINRLVMSGRVINNGGYQLEVTQRASLNGGKIYNGTIKLRGAYAFFQGTNTNCTIDCIVNQIKFSGGTFDGKGSFEHNGSANGWGEGGCVFNDSVKIKSSGTSYLRMGQSSGDTFNGAVEFISTGTYPMQVAYSGMSTFLKNISLNCTSGGISFCNDSLGKMILSDSGTIKTGNLGITAGTITLKGINQLLNQPVTLSASGTAIISVISSVFNGKIAISAPGVLSKYSSYNDSATFTRTSNNTTAYQWEGGNTFNSTFTLISTNTSSGVLRMAKSSGDTFNADVSFNTTSTAGMEIAYSDTSIFKGSVFINSSKVVFNKSTGVVQIKGGNIQILSGNAPYLFGRFVLVKDSGDVVLQRSMTIDTSLTFVIGVIRSDSIISFKSTATSIGANNLSFIDGPVKKTGNSAFIFPVGDYNKYRPLSITSTNSASNQYKARYYYTPPFNPTSLDTAIGKISTCNYWELSRVAGNENVYVTLSWDSNGCSIIDTSTLLLAYWNGSQWKPLGDSTTWGNELNGMRLAAGFPNTFSYFTTAINHNVSPPTIQPTIDFLTTEEGWYHAFDDNFPLYGYNGANTIDPDQSWEDITAIGLLDHKAARTLRYPAGTVSNYWDWKKGWFLKEYELPPGIVYDKPKYKSNDPNSQGGKFEFFKMAIERIGGTPILAPNILTSDKYYQLASLYRCKMLGIPVHIIELGNEFYLSDVSYNEQFPEPNDYLNKAKEWVNKIKSISPFADTKIAIVGADASEESFSSIRRYNWMERILENLSSSDNVDAITIHQYYASGLSNFTGTVPNMKNLLRKPFREIEKLKNKEFTLIKAANTGPLASHPLELWFTEFNKLDESFNFGLTGTWSHALFHSCMALSYLESQLTTNITSHTLYGSCEFGHIFNSANGFGGYLSIAQPTNINEFTAVGAAFNQILLAGRDAYKSYKLDFRNTAAGLLDQAQEPETDEREVYGWYFESDTYQQIILLNLSIIPYDISLISVFPSPFPSAYDYTEIYSNDPAAPIVGNPIPGSSSNLYLNQSFSHSTQNLLSVQPYSLIRIWVNKPGFDAKATETELCLPSSGSCTTSISLTGLDQGQTYSYTINGGSAINITDSVFTFTATSTGTKTIAITSSGGNSKTIIIEVHAMPNVNVTMGSIGSCTDPVQLSANMPGVTNPADYYYLWTPSNGILSGASGSTCSTPGFATPMNQCITVNPQYTTSYQVFVTDGTCWNMSDEFEVKRAPYNHVSLGEDFTICRTVTGSKNITISAEINSDESFSDPDGWEWKLNNNVLPACTSSVCDFTLDSSDPFGMYTLSAEYSDPGYPCNISDQVNIQLIECCSCSTNAVTISPLNNVSPYATIINVSRINSNFALNNSLTFTTPVQAPSYDPSNNQYAEISPGGKSIICINGDFVIDADRIFRNITFRLNENARILIQGNHKLILQGCTLMSCTHSVTANAMWQGIIIDRNVDSSTPLLSLESSTTNSTKIQDAMVAVSVTQDGEFIIENVLFEDNYIDLKLNDCFKWYDQTINNSTSLRNSVRNSTFTRSVNSLLPPYAGQTKRAAIQLNGVEKFVLGDSTNVAFKNTIQKSLYGIESYNSNMYIYNSSFSEMLTSSAIPGTCIYQQSTKTWFPQYCFIGASTVTSTLVNKFENAEFGLSTQGPQDIRIYNNVFGDASSITSRIRNTSIQIIGNYNKGSIDVGHQNLFYDYRTGIAIFKFSKTVHLGVFDNKFYNGYLNTPVDDFDGTAILLSTKLPIDRMLDARIHNNQIGIWDGSNYYQPRIGIHIANTGGVKIEENEIRFNLTAVPGELYRGIRLEGSPECLVRGNIIDNHLTGGLPGFNGMLTGVRVDVSPFADIKCNAISNVGYCMDFQGENSYVPMADNSMDSYNLGINLGFLNGTTTVPTNIGWQQGNPSTGFGNTWNDQTSDRAEGFLTQTSPIAWYHHNAENFANEECPIPSSGTANSSITPTGFRTGFLEFPCNIDDPILTQARALAFCDIIADTVRYDNPNAADIHYSREHALYRFLKTDTSRIYTGEEDDDAYDAYFNELGVMNLGKYFSVLEYINDGQLDLAMELIQSIDDTCVQEEYLKTVLIIELNSLMTNEAYSTEDSSVLREIAYVYSLNGGRATKLARAMLGLEVEDVGEGGSRLMNRPIVENFNYSVQPVPAKDHLELITNNTAELTYHIFDMVGNNVTIGTRNTEPIDIRELAPGVYTIVVYPENDKQQCLKFIKLK